MKLPLALWMLLCCGFLAGCISSKETTLALLDSSGGEAITVYLLDETKISFEKNSYTVLNSQGKTYLKGKGRINDSSESSDIEIEDTDLKRIEKE